MNKKRVWVSNSVPVLVAALVRVNLSGDSPASVQEQFILRVAGDFESDAASRRKGQEHSDGGALRASKYGARHLSKHPTLEPRRLQKHMQD